MLVFFFCFRLIFLPLWAFFDAAIACGWILLYLATMIYMKRYNVITRCIQFLKMKFLYLYYTLDEWNAMEHIIAERFCLLRFLYISLRITWIIHASAEFRKAFLFFFSSFVYPEHWIWQRSFDVNLNDDGRKHKQIWESKTILTKTTNNKLKLVIINSNE